LIDVSGPFWVGAVAEPGIESKIVTLLAQAGRRVEARLRIGRLPFGKKQMMQPVAKERNIPTIGYPDGGPKFAQRFAQTILPLGTTILPICR